MKIVLPETGEPFEVSFPVNVIVSPTLAELIFTLSKVKLVDCIDDLILIVCPTLLELFVFSSPKYFKKNSAIPPLCFQPLLRMNCFE